MPNGDPLLAVTPVFPRASCQPACLCLPASEGRASLVVLPLPAGLGKLPACLSVALRVARLPRLPAASSCCQLLPAASSCCQRLPAAARRLGRPCRPPVPGPASALLPHCLRAPSEPRPSCFRAVFRGSSGGPPDGGRRVVFRRVAWLPAATAGKTNSVARDFKSAGRLRKTSGSRVCITR